MPTDMEILTKAFGWETDPRRKTGMNLGWTYYAVGTTKKEIERLVEQGYVQVSFKSGTNVGYKLTEKGRGVVAVVALRHAEEKVPAADVLEKMDLVVGFDDIKDALASAVEARQRTHFLLEGPPACAKSVLLEGLSLAVPASFLAFGSRTSAAGLSDSLFERQPTLLLLDEADKMPNACYSVLLGLMEHGQVLETKSGNTRGILLNTQVVAACNSSAKMPPEFLSRFALLAHFPRYTRDEFINVCRHFMSRGEGCPEELADSISQQVYDFGLGDVRKVRGVWQLMKAPTEAEVKRVIDLLKKYGDDGRSRKHPVPQGSRFSGM